MGAAVPYWKTLAAPPTQVDEDSYSFRPDGASSNTSHTAYEMDGEYSDHLSVHLNGWKAKAVRVLLCGYLYGRLVIWWQV